MGGGGMVSMEKGGVEVMMEREKDGKGEGEVKWWRIFIFNSLFIHSCHQDIKLIILPIRMIAYPI